MRMYSTGFSMRAIFRASTPCCSKSSAACDKRFLAPLARPPVFGSAGLKRFACHASSPSVGIVRDLVVLSYVIRPILAAQVGKDLDGSRVAA